MDDRPVQGDGKGVLIYPLRSVTGQERCAIAPFAVWKQWRNPPELKERYPHFCQRYGLRGVKAIREPATGPN